MISDFADSVRYFILALSFYVYPDEVKPYS